ncbi:lytic transglycosylase domain-containing protein [Acidiphilium sp.]|uniref:lytic transglycosylase domain-containing protein n=1 Tax=Acidiphilium sp. TaxID=527 RepID=UPI0025827921|nr:lytic transglycosylase domain-containing protein [Acidiphilium sp.]
MTAKLRHAWRFAGLSALALLAACSTRQTNLSPSQLAARYAANAPADYRPPGPPGDPWGPYIEQASARFDVPAKWIRAVMHVESGGHEYMNGHLTVSSAGAMGLMQLEPETYQEMAARYGLGPDPFNPLDNIMAGTAYIHQMYEIYGSPGFLAAYNAGPGRLDDYLDYRQPLPAQTRHYVAMIAPQIAGVYPAGPSEAEAVAMNQLPTRIPAGIRPADDGGETSRLNQAQIAMRQTAPTLPAPSPSPAPAPVRVAALAPPAAVEPQAVPVAVATRSMPPVRRPHGFGGFSLIPSAEAATPVMDGPPVTRQATPSIRTASALAPRAVAAPRPATMRLAAARAPVAAAPQPTRQLGGGRWSIQVGAYDTPAHAKAALGIAELSAVAMLMKGQPVVEPISTARGRFYRARFVNLPHSAAVSACRQLQGGPTGCAVLSPDAG